MAQMVGMAVDNDIDQIANLASLVVAVHKAVPSADGVDDAGAGLY